MAEQQEAFLKYTDLNEKDNFLRYPTNKLIGVVNTPEELQAAILELNKAGFGEDEINVLCGPKGADRLDVTGEHHGPLAHLYRFVQKFGDMESDNLREYGQELLSDHFLLTIEAGDEAKRSRALNILQAHGGHRINFYGKWQVTGLAS